MTPAPRTRKGRAAPAARPRDLVPSELEEAAAYQALAQQVAALLDPVLAEVDRKLDRISRQLDDLLAQLAQWDAGGIRDLLARLETCGGAAP